MKITNETKITELTVGQFKAVLDGTLPIEEKEEIENPHPLHDISMSTRLFNNLVTISPNGHNTPIEKFQGLSEADLLRLRNFGRGSLRELKEIFNKYGLQFSNTVHTWDREHYTYLGVW